MQFFNEIREFGAKVLCCAVFLLAIGPILLIVGAVYLASASKDSRGIALSSFNGASQTWDTSGFAAFKNAPTGNFTLGVSPSNLLFLPAQTSADSYPDASGANLPANTLYFSSIGTPLVPYNTWAPAASGAAQGGANTQTMKLSRNGASAAAQDVTITPLWSSVTSMSCKSSSTANKDCSPSCSGGYVPTSSGTTRQCYALFSLSSVCLVVQPTTGQLDASGAGCVTGMGGSPVPASITGLDSGTNLARFGFSRVTGQTTVIPQPYTGIAVTVRASTDPYVAMLRLTQGSKDFGLTTAQKISYGIGFLVAGGLITFLVCGGLYGFIKNCQHQKPNYVAQPPSSVMYVAQQEPPPPYMQQPGGYPPPMQQPYPMQPQGYPMQPQGGYPMQPQGYAGYPMQQGPQGYPMQPQGYPPQYPQGPYKQQPQYGSNV